MFYYRRLDLFQKIVESPFFDKSKITDREKSFEMFIDTDMTLVRAYMHDNNAGFDYEKPAKGSEEDAIEIKKIINAM